MIEVADGAIVACASNCVLENGAWYLSHRPVGRDPIGIGGLLNVLVKRYVIGARLHQDDIDAELRDLIAEAVSA